MRIFINKNNKKIGFSKVRNRKVYLKVYSVYPVRYTKNKVLSIYKPSKEIVTFHSPKEFYQTMEFEGWIECKNIDEGKSKLVDQFKFY